MSGICFQNVCGFENASSIGLTQVPFAREESLEILPPFLFSILLRFFWYDIHEMVVDKDHFH